MVAGSRCIVGGYARLPQATAAAQVYQMVAMVALVDKTTDIVLEASVTLVTPVAVPSSKGCSWARTYSRQEEFLEEIAVNYGGGLRRRSSRLSKICAIAMSR